MAKVHFIDLFAFLCSPMKLKLNFFQYVYWVHGFLLMRIWLFVAFVHLPFWGFVFFSHLFSLLWFSLVYDLSIYFDWLWGLLKVYYKRPLWYDKSNNGNSDDPTTMEYSSTSSLWDRDCNFFSVLLFMCKYSYLCICKSVNIFCIILSAVSKLIILKLSLHNIQSY